MTLDTELVVVSNVLVVLASLLVAFVTVIAVVKDENRTILDVVKELVGNSKPRKPVKGEPVQEKLRLVEDDEAS